MTPAAILWALTSKGMSGFCQFSTEHMQKKKDIGQPRVLAGAFQRIYLELKWAV